jgi:hypothetical protein
MGRPRIIAIGVLAVFVALALGLALGLRWHHWGAGALSLQPLQTLRPGMTREQVERVLGCPIQIEFYDGRSRPPGHHPEGHNAGRCVVPRPGSDDWVELDFDASGCLLGYHDHHD